MKDYERSVGKNQKTNKAQIGERALGNGTVYPRNTEIFINQKVT